MPMDHLQAHDEHLAERYLLREMSAAEAEDFERHYFECEECAAAVEAGEILRANARAVIAERPAISEERQTLWDRLSRWWGQPAIFLPVAASLLLGGLALYQGAVTIPALRRAAGAARVLPAFQLLGASRGEAQRIAIAQGTDAFAVAADIPPDAHFAQYLCELTSSGGQVLFQLTAAAPVAGQPITILVPSGNLRAGSFQLSVFAADGSGKRRDRVGLFAFDLEFLR